MASPGIDAGPRGATTARGLAVIVRNCSWRRVFVGVIGKVGVESESGSESEMLGFQMNKCRQSKMLTERIHCQNIRLTDSRPTS